MPREFIRETMINVISDRRNRTGILSLMLKYLLSVLCVLCGPSLSGCADKSIYTSNDLTIRFLRSESYTFHPRRAASHRRRITISDCGSSPIAARGARAY